MAGIKPGLPAQQASALSITPLPLGRAQREVSYLENGQVSKLICQVAFLLPTSYTKCSSTRHLLKEILGKKVFYVAIDTITNPGEVFVCCKNAEIVSFMHSWLNYGHCLFASFTVTLSTE